MNYEAIGAKHLSAFESLAQKYDFKIMQEGSCYRLCAKNKDQKWVPWIGFYPEIDLVSYFGKTDFLNIWLCDTRKDFTPDKCMCFVDDLNNALELTVKNRFFVRTLIDSKDWQEIAQVCDAHTDKRYLSCGVLEHDNLVEIEDCEIHKNLKSPLSEQIQSAAERIAASQLTSHEKVKEPEPEI